MNEITRIHLGRQPFVIAVDAHKQLREYLDAIKEAVGKTHKEVIEEVELRMAELLIERGITEEKAILPEDVKYLKEQLGKPGDFKGDDSEDEDGEESEADASAQKRLFRDEKNGMIAGVCSGLAAFFKVDPVIVRLVFILMTLLWGWGILLYIILWIVVPPAKTSSDRLQMRGKAVTVENLTEVVNREVAAAATRAGKAGKAMGDLVSGIFRVFFMVVGASIVAAAVVALCATWAASGYVLMHRSNIIQGSVAFPVGIKETIFFGAAFVVVNLILFWIYLTGVTMIKRKWSLPGWVTASTVGLFITSVVAGSIVAPDTIRQVRDRYEAAHKTLTMKVEPFENVAIKGDLSFRYEQSDDYKVEVRYFGKQPEGITARVSDKTLTIDAVEFLGKSACKDLCINVEDFPEAVIYAPSIGKINIDGSTDIYRMVDGELYLPPRY